MHKKRKSLLCALIAVFAAFSTVSGLEKRIEIMEYDGSSVAFCSNPVMNLKSDADLPFIYLETGLGRIRIDSIHFEDAFIWQERGVYAYISAQPLSAKITEQKKALYAGVKKTSYAKGISEGAIELFPFSYDGENVTGFKNARIFYQDENDFVQKGAGEYDYLIVCPQSYDTVFERLAEWKMKRGFRTRIYSMEHIESVSSGRDKAEQLRNFIKDEFASNGISYLLLAGDRGTIPVRKLFFMECGAGYYTDEDSIPSDIYYTNLDGDFDYDGDNTFGELEDSCDLIPDLCGGRILFDTIYYGPSAIVSRIISYEQTRETEHLSRGIFSGMVLWNPPYTPGGEAKNMIINDIIPQDFHIKKFYESEGHSGKSDILDSIDAGYGIFNHNGHGSYKGIWVDSMTSITRGDATSLTNGMKTGMLYSIGCWVGAFDRDNTTYNLHSIAENLHDSPTGGFISIFANSRYGWGAPGYAGWGVSDVLDYRFFKLLFNSENREAGSLLNTLKRELAPLSADANLYRWHLYEINYFGDPSTFIYTKKPDMIYASWTLKGGGLAVRVLDSAGAGRENLTVSALQDTFIFKALTDGSGYVFLPLDTSYGGFTYITVYGGNCMTVTDSFTIDSVQQGGIEVTYSPPAFFCANTIKALNRGIVDATVRIAGRIIDTTFILAPQESADIPYLSSADSLLSDTLVIYNGGVEEERMVAEWSSPAIKIDSLKVESGNLNAYLSKTPSAPAAGCSLRIAVTSADTILDTLMETAISKNYLFSHPFISVNDDIIRVSAGLYNGVSLISEASDFLTLGAYLFCDSFYGGFENWSYIEDDWSITYDHTLHPGYFNGYENGMNTKIASSEFTLVPGALCSLEIDAQLPALEFVGGTPIFDLDGILIKLISGSDTSTLDFISSGGALPKGMNTSITIKGWKCYEINTDSLINAKLLLNFVSDSAVTDRGVYIKNIRVISPNTYDAYMSTVLREEPSVFSSDSLTYETKGLKTPLKFSMISLDGRIIRNRNISLNGRFSVNMTGLPSGVYFIIFESGGKVYRDKVLYFR